MYILADSPFVGKVMYCKCIYNNAQVYATRWGIAQGSQFATINQNGRLDVLPGVVNERVVLECSYNGLTAAKSINVSYDNQLTIECNDVLEGSSANVIARYNQLPASPTWSIVKGGDLATIDQDGVLTISRSGTITIQATYWEYTTTKTVRVQHDDSKVTQTTVDEDGNVTSETQTTTQNQDGSTTTSTSSHTTNYDGSESETQSTTTQNQDGSSSTQSTTTNSDGTSSHTQQSTSAPNQSGDVVSQSTTIEYDSNGDSTGSQTNQTTVHQDGSSESTTTNYNVDGDPTDVENQSIDVDGNASTQNITYDDNGDPVVTGYTIDTSEGETGSKEFDQEGVNTEFYGFNSVDGFVMDIHFTIDFTDQPPNQNEGLHNVLTMKRANPSPWYGFQIRHSGSGKYVQLGTQFEFGSNTNTAINPTSANWVVQNQTAEYNIQVVYDPALFSDTFVARELLSNKTIFKSNYLFPDLPELRYLTVCVGCALDENAQPYRYSKINVINFNLRKLVHAPAEPVMAFSENTITMTCDTAAATIYYKIGNGQFVEYTSPIEISEDCTVSAYAKSGSQTSETVTQTFVYDDGIEEPLITCDGEYVEINCSTSGADIYYRVGDSGSFVPYESPFEISQTVTVQAYSTLDDKRSETVSTTCTYVPISLADPTIRCDENLVIISCSTPRTTLYYRLDQVGNFQKYEQPFSISQDTLVEAYSTYKTQTSNTVSRTCEYTPEHDYSKDYLTFKALTSGTICWKAFGGLTKTIEYSVNNGSWTSITSTSGGATISVAANDVVRFRGSNTTYATSKSAYSGFEGGTAQFDVEGNIMSLLYGDGFASNTALTNSTYQFCSLFKKSLVVSARNLVLPTTTLTNYCYRALFSWCTTLAAPPELPATTLALGCYWYMFEQCGIMKAPELPATTLVNECYGHMFEGCALLNTIVCRASSGFNKSKYMENWTLNVSATGTYVKSSDKPLAEYPVGASGIPTGWIVSDDILLYPPEISFDGETIEIACDTEGAEIYYRLGQAGEFHLYQMPISILEDTTIETYSFYQGHTSQTITQTCVYVQETPYEQSNKSLPTWRYGGNAVNTPYSVNRVDGHSSNYSKGTFAFETSVVLKAA